MWTGYSLCVCVCVCMGMHGVCVFVGSCLATIVFIGDFPNTVHMTISVDDHSDLHVQPLLQRWGAYDLYGFHGTNCSR